MRSGVGLSPDLMVISWSPGCNPGIFIAAVLPAQPSLPLGITSSKKDSSPFFRPFRKKSFTSR